MFGFFRKTPKSTRRPTVRLGLERLEARELMTATPVTYHGGPTLAHVQVEAVYYGQDWNRPTNYATPGQLNSYLSTITKSSYLAQLGEYGVGTGNFGGSDLVAGAASPKATVNASGQITEAQVTEAGLRAMLTQEIQQGRLPESTGSQAYVVFLPNNVQSQRDVANGFMAHHSSFTMTYTDAANVRHSDTVYYIVAPSPVGNVTTVLNGKGLSNFDKVTEATSHELAETVTDPLTYDVTDSKGNVSVTQTGWFQNGTNDEIGDLANADFDRLDGYCVQKEWSQALGGALLTLSDDASTSHPSDGSIYYNHQRCDLLNSGGQYYARWWLPNGSSLQSAGWFAITADQYNQLKSYGYTTSYTSANSGGDGPGGGGGGVSGPGYDATNLHNPYHVYGHRMM